MRDYNILYREWDDLGLNYPGEDSTTRKIFDVLTKNAKYTCFTDRRSPIFEWGFESCPSVKEVWDLAVEIAASINE